MDRMNERLEGTFFLDGLIEGRIATPDFEDELRSWLMRVRAAGLHFHLEVEGGGFSLLGENDPVAVGELAQPPAERIAQALEDLLERMPADARAQVFSTLRSIEYRPNTEVQTLFAVSDGQVTMRQRSSAAETVAPPQPLDRRDKLKLLGVGLATAVLAVAISTFFVDYRAVWDDVVQNVSPFDIEALEVDLGAFERYFTIEQKKMGKGASVNVVLERTDAFPTTPEEAEALVAAENASLAERLAAESLARGYVRVEFFDHEGKYMGASFVRVAPLRDSETHTLNFPLSRNPRTSRIAMVY
jgi:hypothetical protein